MGRGRRKSEPLPPGQERVDTTSEAKVKVQGGIGAFGLPEAPVFYPTDDEFKHPLRYIDKIRPQAEAYGLCRIVPPDSWNPPLGFDTAKFTFPTKLQAIHQLQERPAACDADTFKLEYGRFLRKQGETMESWPWLDGEELDLCIFYNSVKRHGGYDKVTAENKWGEVVRLVESEDEGTAKLSSRGRAARQLREEALRQLYEKHLRTFEIYQAKVGSGKRWRVARKKDETQAGKQVIKPIRGRKSQTVGDEDLNEPLVPIKSNDGPEVEREALATDTESTPVGKRSSRGRTRTAGACDDSTRDSKKRRSVESDRAEDRSSVSGGVDGLANPVPSRKRRKLEKFSVPEVVGRNDQICEQCRSGAHALKMLLCDRCDRGWHLYCLSPPLSSVPVGNWYCLDCIGSESQSFGFGQGQEYSFDSFRRMADRFKRGWFGSKSSTHTDIERDFWRVVERNSGPVEVLYGSDLDTGKYGSGFPRASDAVPQWSSAEAWNACAENPWNVNNFPKLEGSVLRLVHDNIPGVMVPWLYIGMLFSSFCWHYEDHCFYSVNYLHCGEPKAWYSVPGHAAEAFEKVMQKAFPDLFAAQPDLLFQLVTMLNPSVLRDNGIPVCTTVQEARNFVITFPRSYHGGFNHGFNCAEAVNFAPTDWLPFGSFGVERYRFYHKAAVLSHDELLCVVAKNDGSCAKSQWLQQDLIRMISKERRQREYLWSTGMVKSSRMAPRDCQDFIGAEEDEECIICRYYLHLSSVVCRCRPGKAVCLQHARQLCECNADQQCLHYRFSLAELDDLVSHEDQESEDAKVGELAAVPSSNKRRLRRGQYGASSLNSPLMKKVKGRLYKHSELAEGWLNQARAAGRGSSRSPVLEELLSQSEQFLWGGHEMDEVRTMVEHLKVAHKWVQDVAGCAATVDRHSMASSGKAVKVPLSRIQELVAVDPVPWVEPHLFRLKTLLEPACCLQQKIIDALAASPPLEIKSLQSLQQEVVHSPFELPELQQLKDAVTSAQTWSEKVRKVLPTWGKALRNRGRTELADLQQLRALLEEGLKIPVMVSEKDLLESIVSTTEAWQELASSLLSSATLQELAEALKDSEAFPVRLPEVDMIETRIQKARSWIQDAGAVLSLARAPADYADIARLLEDLIESGQKLQVKGIREMATLQGELEKVRWMQMTSQHMRDRPTIDLLKTFTLDIERLKIAEGSLVRQIRSTLADALAWETKAKELLRSGGPLIEFVELTSSAESLNVQVSGLEPVEQAVADAHTWLNRAKPFTSVLPGSDEGKTASLGLSALEEVVADAKKLLVTLEEASVLTTTLSSAQEWVGEAQILKSSVLVSQERDYQNGFACRMESGEWKIVTQKTSEVTSLRDDQETRKRLRDDLDALDKALSRGVSFGLKIPEILELQGLHDATTWSLQALKLSECRPTVKELEKHLSYAANLPVKVPQVSLLQKILNDAKSWLKAAAAVLPGTGVKGSCNEQQMKQLIADAQSLAVSVTSEVRCLEDILASHRAWKTKVQQALAGASCLTWRDLSQLQIAGEANMVENIEEVLLNQEAVSVGSWVLKCYESIIVQPSRTYDTLEELLLQMRMSVEYGIQQLESEGRSPKESLCICRRVVEKSDSNSLSCESCGDRYHGSCVGVTAAQTRGQKQTVCPFCSAVASGICSFSEDISSKVHLIRRPKLLTLLELQRFSKNQKCRMKEKELLDTLVELVQSWQKKLQAIIEQAMFCRRGQEAVSQEVLVGLLKTMEVMELEGEKINMVKKAVAANAWRNRSVKLLTSTSKPVLRPLTRAIKEGLALSVSGEDCVLEELRYREGCATQWAAQAKQVVGDHGRMPLPDVLDLLAEGEMLPVLLPKELAALKSRSILYCLCQKPYDEDRAMIECDQCGEWYHFSCINLPEPPEDTDGGLRQESEHSGDFICPKCQEMSNERDSEDARGAASSPASYRNQAQPKGMVSGQNPGDGSSSKPFYGLVRGKRSSRSNGRTRGEAPHKWHSPLFQHGKLLWHTQRRRKQSEHQSDESVSASGRPCRRTAGRHSGFESFVLLMRSR
ncbi:hypothetical protein R1flu_029047 [Riccia fluitans]|uniref:[histone H3]-trimethyl-L-lysine(4) demethylase n=1 Tax=Riccia fluitans TaxID=41844 RepID=A0ABD1XNG8_9MARC